MNRETLNQKPKINPTNFLIRALVSLNNARGRGTIIRVEMESETHGFYYVRLQYGEALYGFRIVGNRVFARGSSRKFR